MKKIHGIGASKGYAIGNLTLCVNIDDHIEKKGITDVAAELSRLETAKEVAVEALNKIYLNALKRVGEANSMIFQIHIMMLQDEDYFSAIQNAIKNDKVNAEYAVWQAGRQFAEMFSQMDDEYMRGRSADVIDISKRLIRSLDKSLANGLDSLNTPSIVGAVDLMPSETVQMDKKYGSRFCNARRLEKLPFSHFGENDGNPRCSRACRRLQGADGRCLHHCGRSGRGYYSGA